ncbi:MAG TPA: heme exporter protein CcmD [Stellaceae bacterium]|nr:heme exporter protein CcmD [Stellaceae bacterium]
MSGLSHWAAMGGYAAFVWPAYGVAVAILGAVAAQSWWRYRTSRRALDRLQGGSRLRP